MTSTQLQWHLEGGGSATLLETDGVRATLRASRSFPPGSTLHARPAPEGTSAMGPLQVKVRDCVREPSGAFCVTGRFVSLPKAMRQRLLEALESSSEG